MPGFTDGSPSITRVFMKRPSIVVLATLITWQLGSCSQSERLPADLYQTLDGMRRIRVVSGDELELTEGGGNLVCKYTRKADSVRVVVNAFGGTQALYYTITADGLRDDRGATLYTLPKLKEEQERIRIKQEREVASARAAAERVRARTEESRRESKVLGKVSLRDASKTSEYPGGEAIVTDVGIKINSITNGRSETREVWYGSIIDATVDANQGGYPPAVVLRVESPSGFPDYVHVWTAGKEGAYEFHALVEPALEVWRNKYPDLRNNHR